MQAATVVPAGLMWEQSLEMSAILTVVKHVHVLVLAMCTHTTMKKQYSTAENALLTQASSQHVCVRRQGQASVRARLKGNTP